MSIKFSLSINAGTHEIFKAVTSKKGYQGWWAKVCDVDCKLNGISSIRFEKSHITEEMQFKTIEVENDRKLVWQCIANNVFSSWIGSVITYDIRQRKGKNQLLFTQTSSVIDLKSHKDYEQSVAGWNFFLESLKSYCETGKGDPWG